MFQSLINQVYLSDPISSFCPGKHMKQFQSLINQVHLSDLNDGVAIVAIQKPFQSLINQVHLSDGGDDFFCPGDVRCFNPLLIRSTFQTVLVLPGMLRMVVSFNPLLIRSTFQTKEHRHKCRVEKEVSIPYSSGPPFRLSGLQTLSGSGFEMPFSQGSPF